MAKDGIMPTRASLATFKEKVEHGKEGDTYTRCFQSTYVATMKMTCAST
jgi:hypothetical protein